MANWPTSGINDGLERTSIGKALSKTYKVSNSVA